MKKIIIPLLLATFLFMGCEHQPFADFTSDFALVEPGEVVHFTNYSDDADHFVWDFGDGYTSDVANPSHFYDFEGTYTVTLSAFNKHGGSDIATMQINVYYNLIADFVVSNSVVEPLQNISFTNTSEKADHFLWDFGDGYTTTVVNPQHIYSSEGTFTVTLEAVGETGNSDIMSMVIEVYYTRLEVTVAEWNEYYEIEYIVPDARVRLYPSMLDWENETRLVTEGYTNDIGIVTFVGIDPGKPYYIDILATEYDNIDIKIDFPDLIYIAPLPNAYTTQFIGWADYKPLNSAKKSRVSTGELRQARPVSTVKATTKIK